MNIQTLAQDWNNAQVSAKDAHDKGDEIEAHRYLNEATQIEVRLQELGQNIRDIVCP